MVLWGKMRGMRKMRLRISTARRRRVEQQDRGNGNENGNTRGKAVEDLKALVEACVKNNFVGVENSRLYSQTYYGTKNMVQDFIDEGKPRALLLWNITDGMKSIRASQYL